MKEQQCLDCKEWTKEPSLHEGECAWCGSKNVRIVITRGGAGAGSGRKLTGRTVTTSSINLPPELWDKLDALRGELTRSAWIAAKIKNARI